ncbi:MAG: plastocyanin/azurin family copper-binding protein, partial [Rhodothermales bacterium]
QTSRGWSATGRAPYALERVVWMGSVPFEMHSVAARSDGFEITFTLPVDPTTASDPASYEVTGFTYHYHSTYGSPPIDQMKHPVRAVELSADGKRARLLVEGLREGYIHELKASGVRSVEGVGLLHDVSYYTLNRIPQGPRMNVTPVSKSGEREVETEIAPSEPDVSTGLKRVTGMPAEWNGVVDVTVAVGTEPGLKFDLTGFDVRPGDHVRLTFANDDDMLHNLVIVRPGRADAVAEAALSLGLAGAEMSYVPPDDDVLYHTALLQPGTVESIYFTAPARVGTYAYVCTFPGHAFTMRGMMRVVE